MPGPVTTPGAAGGSGSAESVQATPFLAGHFDNQVQEVTRAVAIVDTGDEVGKVVLILDVQRVRDGEA
jgi:hypothetical protein